MKKNNIINKVVIVAGLTLIFSQTALAAKFKCWTNNEGVKECGSYVPAEFSQKRIETRSGSGRVIEVDARAKSQAEIDEIARLTELKRIEDEKLAEQKKKDDILLKTFTRERDINMLRDSKVNVIEGIITVTNGNNKALAKKLAKKQKKAANIERRGKKPPARLLEDMKAIETRISKNKKSISTKREEQKVIKAKFAIDLQRFQALKNRKKK